MANKGIEQCILDELASNPPTGLKVYEWDKRVAAKCNSTVRNVETVRLKNKDKIRRPSEDFYLAKIREQESEINNLREALGQQIEIGRQNCQLTYSLDYKKIG